MIPSALMKLIPKFLEFANGPFHWRLACYGSIFTLLLVWGVLIMMIVGQVDNYMSTGNRQGEYTPLYGSGFDGPQKLKYTVISPGTQIETLPVTKCNGAEHEIAVTGTMYWRRLDQPGSTIVGGSGALLFNAHECLTFDFINPLPSTIREGQWQLIGIETTIDQRSDSKQVIAWETEPFVVVLK